MNLDEVTARRDEYNTLRLSQQARIDREMQRTTTAREALHSAVWDAYVAGATITDITRAMGIKYRGTVRKIINDYAAR